VPAHKLRVLPYGVDLTEFHPTARPADDRFDVLFAGGASLRKGVPDLLDAFHRVKHPRKQLWFAGAFPDELRGLMQRHGLWSEQVVCLGHLPQSALRDRMSRSHVLVLPSIEDGFGLVMAQAMACACPVIATEHTGAEDLYQDGTAGFIVPPRRSDLLADGLQRLADSPQLRSLLSQQARALVAALGGWSRYGDQVVEMCDALTRAGRCS
jgi:alpha-maltose-1-phosphate synthase